MGFTIYSMHNFLLASNEMNLIKVLVSTLPITIFLVGNKQVMNINEDDN